MAELVTLVIVSILAVVAPTLLTRLKLPIVVGELGIGLLAGAANLAASRFVGEPLFAPGELLNFLATLGVILLFFLIGLELDFDLMESQGPRPIVLGVVMLAGNLVIAYAAATFLGFANVTAFFIALVLAETSVAVLFPTLRDMGLTGTTWGQSVLIYGLIAEFGVVILIALFSLTYNPATGLQLFSPEALLLIPALVVFFYLVYRLGGWAMWNYPRALNRFFLTKDPAEMGVRASLALMFIFVALTETLGAEAILGSLFAGTVVSLLFRESEILERKLFGIGYGFLIPIFFINAGLSFDFGVFTDPRSLLLIPLLLGVVLLGKLAPAAVLVPEWGLRRAAASGFILASRLTLSVAVVSIGLTLGLISRNIYSAIILLAVIMAVMTPVLFRWTLTVGKAAPEAPAGDAEAGRARPEGGDSA